MGVQQAIIEEREPVRHLLTVDEFLILDEAGAFDELGRVELIDGEITSRVRSFDRMLAPRSKS